MGFPACKHRHARNCNDAGRRDDRKSPARTRTRRYARLAGCLIALATPATSGDSLLIAYYHTELSSDGPGRQIRQFTKNDDAHLSSVLSDIASIAPDVLIVSGIDYDVSGTSLTAFSKALTLHGQEYPFTFSAAPNSGVPVPASGKGRERGSGPDAVQAFGKFRYAGGLALLSRIPIIETDVQNFSEVLWASIPWATPPFGGGSPNAEWQRLSTKGHWDVPLHLDSGRRVNLLVVHATPPVFDGPEDYNGRRNADELRFWTEYLSGWHPRTTRHKTPEYPIVIGSLNADPNDGESRPGAVARLLNHRALQDPRPESPGAAWATARDKGVNALHKSPSNEDTVDWPDTGSGAPGNLRVDYILPARQFSVEDSGVHWPAGAPDTERSRHYLVWMDLRLP